MRNLSLPNPHTVMDTTKKTWPICCEDSIWFFAVVADGGLGMNSWDGIEGESICWLLDVW